MTNFTSFRDPAGHVYEEGGRIFRTVSSAFASAFQQVRASGLITQLIKQNLLLPERIVKTAVDDQTAYVLEHPKLPFISYPYEWSFAALRLAALLHLNIQLIALEHQVALSDASAYNVQFIGPNPIFIDHLSFRPYHEGEFWLGHRQFCEQFLNPLLLRAKTGIAANAWYRGALHGITAAELRAVLSFKQKLSWQVFMHIMMPTFLQNTSQQLAQNPAAQVQLPRQTYYKMLRGLYRWIKKLQPAKSSKNHYAFSDYAQTQPYTPQEKNRKDHAIKEFLQAVRPHLVWDLGCHNGEYASLALAQGARLVIGFETNPIALDQAFQLARQQKLAFLPLYMDLMNPTPNQGFAEQERSGLSQRAPANAILSLAILHHLAIAHNAPLDCLAAWLAALAPQGLVEFVTKADPKVQELLRLRQDIFSDYTLEHFLACLQRYAEVVKVVTVSEQRRYLVWFKRK